MRRAGVVSAGGSLSVSGLLALGTHPQQWFPRYVIQAVVEPRPGNAGSVRGHNATTITGPIPVMLAQAMAWARRNFDAAIVTAGDGTVKDAFAYPLDAFRELIANALIHRDLDQWSQGLAIEVRLRPDRLVIDNPGGLYGITVDRLGRDAVTSARNARLVAVCQYVRTPGTDARVIEALASGIPIVRAALGEAGLPDATFVDSGIRFTVILKRRATTSTTPSTLNATEERIYRALLGGARSVADLEASLDLAGPNIRKALRALRVAGLVDQIGGPGKPTVYQRAED